MPGATPTTSTQVVNNTVPQWVSDAGQANYNKAVSLDNSPLQQFAGSEVAPLSDQTKQAFNFFNQNLGAGSVDTAGAADVFRRMSDPNAFASGVKGFMNPYVDDVVNTSMRDMNDQLNTSLQGNADKAIAAKAFGGSRGAVVDAVTRAQSAKDSGTLSAQLRSQAFTDAANRLQSGLTTEGQGLLSTGDQEQSQMLKQFAGLTQIGQTNDTQNQGQLNDKVRTFNEQRDKELNDLNVRLASLGMTPYSTQSQTNTSTTPGSAGTDYGALGIGLLSLLAGLV